MTTRKSHKQRGATFETALRDWFREMGMKAERLARTGKEDEGDIYIEDFSSSPIIIEAKAPGSSGRITLAGWLGEAVLEATNYQKHRNLEQRPKPIVVIKARGKSIDDAYVVIRLKDYPW
jgi:predicted nuclease of predicted toxin-antitoxin system